MDVERLIKRKKRVKRDGNLQQLAQVVKELGDIYFETRKYEDALQEYTEQLQVCEVLQDKLNIAVAHRMIGEMLVNLGNHEEALCHQNSYLEGAQEIKNLLEEQRAYATLGRTYFCWAESLDEKSEKKAEALKSARKAYRKSILLCNELEGTDIALKEMITMRARLLLNLGLVLEAQREHQQAIDLMEKAAALCETHHLQDDFHRTQIALGGIQERNGGHELALKHFEKAETVDNATLKVEARLLQAELLLKIERWHEARNILVSLYVAKNLSKDLKHQVEKCLRIVATLHVTEDALVTEESTNGKLKLYETLGDAAIAARCYERAIDYYRKMLQCAEEINSDRISAALSSLAQTLKDVGQYKEALSFAQKELELCIDSREKCRSALFLAELLIVNNETDDKINETFDLAFKNAKSCSDVSLEASVLKERLIYLKDSGKMDEMNTFQERLDSLGTLSNTDSDDESEENEIGANICLEELSDVESELKAKESIRTSKRRTPKRSAVVKRNEKGETQLHVACINGNVENAEQLLATGHPTNIRDNFGWTPLHEAANHDHVEVARLLLKNGADVNDPGGIMCQGVTPLHDAASCGNLSMMRLLIEYGANIELKTAGNETVLDCLEQWKNRIESLSSNDQADYDEMYKNLSAVIPNNKTNWRQSSKSPSCSETHVEEDDTGKKFSAGEDYKRTIANLKHRSDPTVTSLNRSKRIANPLLNSEDVLLDDWLEDDTSENVQKKYSDEKVISTSKRKSSNGEINDDRFSKRQKTNIQNPMKKDAGVELIEDESNDSCDIEVSRSFNERRFLKRRQQVSLLSIGFTKDSVSRSPPSATPSPTEFDSKVDVVTKSVILNIFVEGKLFKTQVELSSTTKPLMQDILDDIEKKFYNDSGCKAKFHLKTMNDIAINPENIFTILNEQNTVKNIKCEVIELNIPSIVERYGTVCKTYNIAVRELITKCLKSCENTFMLRLKQENISKEELMSVLKTVEYQKNVQIVDLSGGELHEMGEVLNDSILKLSTLQELCLQGCDIDSKCLSKLEKLPSQLKLLDLSYNPLGSSSQEILRKLLAPLTQLQTLNLRYCQLCNIQYLANNSSLVNLDISSNNFNEDGFCTSLQRQLLTLNLSYTVSSNDFNLVKSIFNKTNFSFVNLECLNLIACNLFDIDVKNILSQVSNLSKLVLRANTDISITSLNLLLNHTPTIRHIDISGCKKIAEDPDFEVFIERPEICTLIASMFSEVCEGWLRLWQGKAVVKKLVYDVVVFKPTMGNSG